MVIGVPKEIKVDEYRVAVTPAGAETLVAAGHQLVFEEGAGIGSGFTDDLYEATGARVAATAEEVWAAADMIMKVKDPIEPEWPRMRSGQVIFTYFHFAASEALTTAVRESGAVAIAYETVELPTGELPLLTPMSEIAGRMAVQAGAKHLEKPSGPGVLLSGVPGVLPGKVLILGGGVVGTNAAKIAAGLGARVAIMDIDLERLRYLDDVMPANVHTLFSTRPAIRKQIEDADLIIGAVLIPGAKAPSLITVGDLAHMREGTVVVDVAVDQGGCVETIRPTTHRDPVYSMDGVIHYGVANMPSGVSQSSTLALTNVTLPYALKLAGHGWRKACANDPALKRGLNVVDGRVTHPGVASAFECDIELDDVDALIERGASGAHTTAASRF
jgi:alanine dehydrogenase